MRTRKSLVAFARALRQQETKAEQILWSKLRNRNFQGHKFRRQHPIGIHYVADFYCAKKKLIIEIDGSIHQCPDIKEKDILRESFLKEWGYKVIRITNDEIFSDINKVLDKILKAVR